MQQNHITAERPLSNIVLIVKGLFKSTLSVTSNKQRQTLIVKHSSICLSSLGEILENTKLHSRLISTSEVDKVNYNSRQLVLIHSDKGLKLETIGDLLSKETVCCVGGKVKH